MKKPNLSGYELLRASALLLCITQISTISCRKSVETKAVAVQEAPPGQTTEASKVLTQTEVIGSSSPEYLPKETEKDRQAAIMQSVALKNQKIFELERTNSLVGIEMAKLTEMLGPPSSVEAGIVTYRFDTGLGGTEWKLLVEKERVGKVTKIDIN